jgi:hypothetical protein
MRTLWVNLEDEIMLTFFKSTAADFMPNSYGFLAPELRQSTASGEYASDQLPTFQSDIFQLGLTIWMLAEHVHTIVSPKFISCTRMGCKSFPRYRCTADHANPVELPLSGGEVPEFVNEIVNHCRQSQPSRRKPASTLLTLVPTDNSVSDSYTTRFAPCYSEFAHIRSCAECAEVTTDENYHCNACDKGDFDLCPDCISRGIRCFEDTHKLRRIVFKNGRYFDETVDE